MGVVILRGEFIEFGQRRQIIHNNQEKNTEDYITCRFG